jgi:asparagine synthetase B (glutamine-hydrolysing)
VVDEKTGKVFAARDHMGKIPMYIAYGKDGSTWFASEMKVRWPLRATALAHAGGFIGSGGTSRVCMRTRVAWRPAVRAWWGALPMPPWLRQPETLRRRRRWLWRQT